MTEVGTDANDKAILSDKLERGHIRTRNSIRKESKRLAIRDRRKAFFSQFMDVLSDEMLIEPLKRFQELSQSDLIDTVSSITQFIHMESFNKKLMDIQFQQIIVNLLMSTDKIEIKIDLILALTNLSYFSNVSTDRILELKIPSFLLAQIKATGFSNSKQKAYIRNITSLIRNLVCSSIYDNQFSSYLLDQSYISLLIGKISNFQQSDVEYIRQILDSITKTLQIIIKKNINHSSLINQCLNIFTLKENTQIKPKCLSGLYVSFLQNISETTLCDIFQNPNVCYAIEHMLNNVDKNSQDAVYGLEVLKTLKLKLPDITTAIFVAVSQSIIDLIKSDNQVVKLAALKTFTFILEDIASVFEQNKQILEQVIKVIFQTINIQNRSNHLQLIQHVVGSFYWLSGTHIMFQKGIHKLLIDILIQQQDLTIGQVCRILNSFEDFLESQHQQQSNIVKSLINDSEALALIKKYQQCNNSDIAKAANKLLKKL